jgi:hypothetical protein
VGAMLEPLGERVAALTAEQRKYFISRVRSWEALMEPKGNKQSAPGRCVSKCLVRPAATIFRDAPDFWFAYTQKRVWLSSTPESPSGLGEGKVFPTPGDPKSALYRIWFNAYLTT